MTKRIVLKKNCLFCLFFERGHILETVLIFFFKDLLSFKGFLSFKGILFLKGFLNSKGFLGFKGFLNSKGFLGFKGSSALKFSSVLKFSSALSEFIFGLFIFFPSLHSRYAPLENR
ncbi:hypothetical protein [uncultured Bacteroides sp.]|uniref:hypothetical protein n=1 Tax=uncultured Bacteroides sp. TaxID=162156 RepID=UPI00260E638D|nr:hypothetical protein [uncultured Bacteroides sp.]